MMNILRTYFSIYNDLSCFENKNRNLHDSVEKFHDFPHKLLMFISDMFKACRIENHMFESISGVLRE